MSDHLEQGSLILCEIFNCCRFSKVYVDFYKSLLPHSTLYQQISIFDIFKDYEISLCGSVSEGLAGFITSSGTSTDLDMVLVPRHCIAYRDPFIRVEEDEFQLQIHASHNPGFVMLEVVKNGHLIYFPHSSQIMYCVMVNGRSYLSNDNFRNTTLFQPYYSKQQENATEWLRDFSSPGMVLGCQPEGPSLAAHLTGIQCGDIDIEKIDNVVAIKCPEWPLDAMEWVTRKREYNWPPRSLILKHFNGGVYAVPVGCISSPFARMEWRLSFNSTERDLNDSFNDTQIKCYCALKLLLKLWLKPKTMDVITSYTMKTSLFWIIEETPSEMWVPENLLRCINLCLNRVLQWVLNEFCPHYFIPKRNMFLGHFGPSEKSYLIHTLIELLTNVWTIIISIEPIQLLYDLNHSDRVEILQAERTLRPCLMKYEKMSSVQLLVDFIVIHIMETLGNQLEITNILRSYQFHLRNLFDAGKTKKNGDILIPVVQHLMFKRQCLSILYKFHPGMMNKDLCPLMESLKKMRVFAERIGGTSEIVLVAHTLVALKKYSEASSMLTEFLSKQAKKYYVRTNMSDSDKIGKNVCELIGMLYEAGLDHNIDVYNETPIVDVVFLLAELHWLPKPIKVEFCAESTRRDAAQFLDLRSILLHTVKVDPLVFACYLKFHCSKKMHLNIQQIQDLKTFKKYCFLSTIQRKDIAFNLLGYCHMKLEEYENAFEMFKLALKENPRNKASLWHIAKLVNTKIWREWTTT